MIKLTYTLLKLGLIFQLLLCFVEPAIANEHIIESELSLEENLVLDKEMNTLFGPRRYRLAYRDYTALQEDPDLPPIGPLYKQQPAFAQGDFRDISTDSQPSFVKKPYDKSLPRTVTPDNPDPGSNESAPDSGSNDAVPDPPSSDSSTPTVDLPGNTVPTLPPWITIPSNTGGSTDPPTEGGGIVN